MCGVVLEVGLWPGSDTSLCGVNFEGRASELEVCRDGCRSWATGGGLGDKEDDDSSVSSDFVSMPISSRTCVVSVVCGVDDIRAPVNNKASSSVEEYIR